MLFPGRWIGRGGPTPRTRACEHDMAMWCLSCWTRQQFWAVVRSFTCTPCCIIECGTFLKLLYLVNKASPTHSSMGILYHDYPLYITLTFVAGFQKHSVYSFDFWGMMSEVTFYSWKCGHFICLLRSITLTRVSAWPDCQLWASFTSNRRRFPATEKLPTTPVCHVKIYSEVLAVWFDQDAPPFTFQALERMSHSFNPNVQCSCILC